MNVRLPITLLLVFTSFTALADACDVVTRAQSDQLPMVEQHTCYHYEGMPPEAIDWSCSNENKEMMPATKNKVAACSSNHVASCKATPTQEALANPHSTSKAPDHEGALLPKNARVVTYYYAANDLVQAKIDCEKAGGEWASQPVK